MVKFSFRRPALALRHKIISVVFIVLFPVLILTSGLFFYNHSNFTRSELVRQYTSITQSLGSYIAFIEQDISDLAIYFSINADINRLLSEHSEDVPDDPLLWTNLGQTNTMHYIITLKRHIQTIILYPENGLPPFFISKDVSVHDTNIENIRELEIYHDSINAMGNIVFTRVNAGESGLFLVNRSDKIIFSRTLFNPSRTCILGFMAISVDVSWYESIIRNALLNDDEAVVILGPAGDVLIQVGYVDYSTLTHIQSYEDHQMQYGDWYIFSSDSTNNGKRVYHFSPQSYWTARINRGLVLPITLMLALLACFVPLSILSSRAISRPLDSLNKSMNKFKEGDFDQQVEVKGRDEIATLSHVFNAMVNELKELIDRNYIMALREREIELNSLQAQINPHFLYNALDALYWQAIENGLDDLSDDILAISDLFRLLLSCGDSEITVERELEIISRYLHIQKMRFSKKIDYSIDVDERLYQCMIPKLILQPFVENAVVHGLEKQDEWGFVKIEGIIKDEMMIFTIEDNGSGMSSETQDMLLSMEKQYTGQRISGYAIQNVMERMKLKYNSHCKFEISSELGIGSEIRISLPLR